MRLFLRPFVTPSGGEESAPNEWRRFPLIGASSLARISSTLITKDARYCLRWGRQWEGAPSHLPHVRSSCLREDKTWQRSGAAKGGLLSNLMRGPEVSRAGGTLEVPPVCRGAGTLWYEWVVSCTRTKARTNCPRRWQGGSFVTTGGEPAQKADTTKSVISKLKRNGMRNTFGNKTQHRIQNSR
jgi:hypothetical protein